MDNARYADLFRIESREHLAELDAALLALEQRGVGASDTDDLVATLFRGVHTIKGMAAAMGYRAVEQLSHALESTLDRARNRTVTLTPDVVALLFDATDALSLAVADTETGVDDADSTAVRAIVQRLGSLSDDRADAQGRDRIDAHHDAHNDVHHDARHDDVFASVVATSGPAAYGEVQLGSAGFGDAVGGSAAGAARGPDARDIIRIVEVRLNADCQLKGVRTMLVLQRLEAMGTVHDVQPPSSEWQDEAFTGVVNVFIDSDASEADLETAARGAGDVARVTVRARAATTQERTPRETMRHVRIDSRRLDTLLDLIGELVISRDRLVRMAETAVEQGADRGLARVAHDTARLVSSLQEEVLQARMVPVGQVFDRFPRLVRDVARELGKDVKFVMEGREIELDRSLLDAIGDPIVHLLRNALDHGLEDSETRREAGKPPTGRLVLRAARDRASIVIQVEDDGRGIDRAAVLRRAVERGLVPAHEADADTFDDDRLLQTLAYSGLSTARAVTAISGRGVGVDVVATRVRALGGFLSLETIEGAGTVFTMRLPATLAITRALLVQVSDQVYALPAAHVVEALEYDPTMRVRLNGREAITLRDEVLPVLRLRQRFGFPPGDHDGYIAIVEASGRRSALVVDGMIAQQDVVVKPLDAVRGGAPWFSGATVLGDGTPSLIVDLGSLI